MDQGQFLTEESDYAIARYASEDDIVELRSSQPVRCTDFMRDVGALAARLPSQPYVLNLCTNRYRFIAGLGAALHRGQITLLPSSGAPAVLQALAEDYPGLYALSDAAQPALPGLTYPDDLNSHGIGEIPKIPADQPAFILFTSGSTGRPKPTLKTWGTLVRSARAAGKRLGITQLRNATVIGTVPHQHSYGLESIVLLSLQHGLRLDAASPLYPGDVRAALERAPRPRILVTTPVHLRALLSEPDGMPQADLILSATAPLPAPLAAQAEACFGAPLIEIYGCTEAGQIATRRTAQETQWQCLDGVDLTSDAQGTWANGASVQGRTLLHDVIEPAGPGRFLLGDRSADLVDVAGKRASLTHLNQQLLGIEGVKDGVFFMGEARGQRVARLTALVVAPGLDSQTVMRGLRERIDAAFLPRPLVFVDQLPRNALGKLPREALLRLAGRSQGA